MPLDKYYTPADVEPRHTARWEAEKAYTPTGNGEPFTIMMPPPNVTGTLHVGHALDNTLPDILIRRARMQGKRALYLPGTDHASIAVHRLLEIDLKKEGKTRKEIGREAFLDCARQWKEHSHGVITSQLRKLGISCDWSRERFTMDDDFNKAVNHAFITLYARGLIYRGKRLVNWDPAMQTVVSDIEVKHKDVKGTLWHVKYLFADGFTYNGENGVIIATTRPETILADGALAINPADPRAADLVGKKVIVPVVNRIIPIIADEVADPTFGSGMLKITAAHDFNDYQVYLRHKDKIEIPLINLMNPNGSMNENCPAAYVGLDRFAARKGVVADLAELGLLVQEEPITHSIPHAERDDTVLEPYLTDQWFVKGEPLAKKCLAALENNEIRFIPERHEHTYKHWLENIQDWCISRQLWWGHRIPAWYKNNEIKVQVESPGEGWVQDEDVLDTWFSSALWPFATLGWPDENAPDFKTFYPTQAIMPGVDILFFWVIRMMMFGLELTGKPPFRDIYLHALVLDSKGQKMSKSKGNVLDPLPLMEKYGTDALRFTLASQAAPGQDIRLSEQRVEASRNFCTKIWNAARFAEMHGVVLVDNFDPRKFKNYVHIWMCGELQDALLENRKKLDLYEFHTASQALYKFVWDRWCDWYVEFCKPLFLQGGEEAIEARCAYGWGMAQWLKALHPTMPYITSEIAAQLTPSNLILSPVPDGDRGLARMDGYDFVESLRVLVGQIRSWRKLSEIPDMDELVVKTELISQLEEQLYNQYLMPMAKTNLQRAAEKEKIKIPVQGNNYYLRLPPEKIDQSVIRKKIDKSLEEKNKIDAQFAIPGFEQNAPEETVLARRERRAELEGIVSQLQSLL